MTVCGFIRNYYSTFHDEKHYELEHQLDGHKKNLKIARLERQSVKNRHLRVFNLTVKTV